MAKIRGDLALLIVQARLEAFSILCSFQLIYVQTMPLEGQAGLMSVSHKINELNRVKNEVEPGEQAALHFSKSQLNSMYVDRFFF